MPDQTPLASKPSMGAEPLLKDVASGQSSRRDLLDQQAQEQMFALFLKDNILGQAVSIAIAFLVAFACSGGTERWAWACFMWLIALLRMRLGQTWSRDLHAPSFPFWARAGSAASGVGWGIGAAWFMFTGGIEQEFFMALVATGMIAGGLPLLSALKGAFPAFAFPAVAGALIGSISHGSDPLQWGMRIGAILFLVATLKTSRSFHEALTSSVWLSIEQTELARELAIARDRAQDANKAKGSFLAIMSHEIRTPLNGIIGMGGLIEEMAAEPEMRQYAKIVGDSGRSLLSILNDMLDYSKIESGKIQLEHIAFDLAPTLIESCETMVFAARAKGIAFEFLMDPSLPTQAMGDPGKIRQVIANLASNAVKFTDKGSIELKAHALMQGASIRLLVSVTDTGIGIAEADQDKLFSPFTQADSSTSRKYGGTGLGLAICKQLCELMGGTLTLESTHGSGSRFEFDIPLEIPTAPCDP